MKSATGSTAIWTRLRILGALLLVASFAPALVMAQQGNNAVYKNATACCQESVAFIDASVFGNSSTDICTVLNGILSGTRGLARPKTLNSSGCPAQASLGRGCCHRNFRQLITKFGPCLGDQNPFNNPGSCIS
jgi:hypothetical protein